MSIDKSLHQAPVGIGILAKSEDPITVEIIGDDDEADETSQEEQDEQDEFDKNLAEDIDDSTMAGLASDLVNSYNEDTNARKDWLDVYIKGLKLLGVRYEERTEPWSGACGVFHPLLMESATKFQAETIMETFPALGPVKTTIIGKETPEKVDASKRVASDMNYELTERMTEYRPEHERMLLSLCLSGNAFKKIYFDPSLGRQTAPYIPAEDIIVPYGATSVENAERVTHRMRKTKNELRKLQIAGFYRDIELGEPVFILDDVEKQKNAESGFNTSADNRYQLLEMHVNLDLDGYEDKDDNGDPTGIELPYVVTVDLGTRTILAIRRNWLADDPLKLRRQHFVHYGYIPGFGFYYFGLIHLIGGHSKAATSLLRQLIDAGTLSNLPGGLKSKGLRIKGDDTPISPGEFRDVDLPAGTIKENILPLPYKEPSLVLLNLMNQVIEDGRRFAAVADLKVTDMSSQSPVGTTLAILERVLKVMSAVQARIHYTMKQEFKLLAAIIRDNTPEDYDYEPEVGEASAKKADYDCCDVIPVSDPNASTMSQRVVQYQAVLQLSQSAPQIYDLPFLHRQMIDTLGVKNAAKIVPMVDDMAPMDPVSENMAILMGKPTKAYLAQDHEAHIQVHMAAMQDPKMQQVIGQNPQAPMIMAAAQAHLMEHVAFQYRKEIEKQLGASLPPPPDFSGKDKEVGYLPPEIEVQISTLAAQAAAKLLQKDQQEAAAQQAQQQAQDPLIQMQQQELQIKAQEVEIKKQDTQIKQLLAESKAQHDQAEQQRKSQKDHTDAQLKAGDLALREKQLSAQTQKDHAQHALNTSVEAGRHSVDQTRAQLDSARLGVEIAKHHADKQHDLHKATGQQTVDLRKHASTLNTEIHKHESAQNLDLHKHETQLGHQSDEARLERDHQAEQARLAAQAARNKPKGNKD
jgi:hypothetical protein